MQGTLLGLGIAIILALVAALVGPHFVDWSQHRSVFEAQASRLLGLPLRVNGTIDVRILPTPSIVLRQVEAEAAGADAPGTAHAARPAPFRAGEAAIELALGPLLRGEWRATEVRLVRPEFALGLDRVGQFAWPGTTPRLDVDALSIEHFTLEDGRATLSDEGSDSSVTLESLWFNGDVRSLAGPLKGEGGFIAGAEHYGYRLSTGRYGEDGLKVRLNVDPSDRPLAVESDGMLRFDRGVPRFEGALTMGRPAGAILARGRAVSTDAWRATSKVKLAPNGGLLDQIEVQYGSDDRAIKLAGTAQVTLGKAPRVDGIISARQVDLDRAFVLPEGTRRVPLAVLRRVTDSFGGVHAPPLPFRLGVSVDSLTLSGAILQTVRGDISNDGQTWNLERFEFRAPGTTQVRASGRMRFAADGTAFTGPAILESNDPKALLGWLEGRSEPALQQGGVLRASGDLTLASDRLAVDRLKAEIDRKAVAGRLAYAWATSARPARVDAELNAAELDIDQAIAFTRAALAGTTLDAPGEVALAVDIASATVGGIQAKGAKAKLSFDSKGLVFERVSVADLDGAALDLNGRIDSLTTAPRGTLTLELDARKLDGVAAVLTKYAPVTAGMMRLTVPRFAPAKLSALLTVERQDTGSGSRAELVVSGRAGPARINVSADATGDVSDLPAAAVNLNGRIYADDGGAMVALFGLDNAVAVDKQPASLGLTATGRLGDLQVDGKFAAARLEGTAKGNLHLFGESGVSGTIDLKAAAADALLLHRPGGQGVPITLRAQLGISNTALTFEGLSAVVAGTGVRGRLTVDLTQPVRLDGRVETDSLDVGAVAAAVAGMPAPAPNNKDPGPWPSDPFVPGAFAGMAGQIALDAQRATLAPTIAVQDLHGRLKFGDGETTFEDLEAQIGGGRAVGQLTLRAAPEGTAARGRLALTDVDLAAIVPPGPRPVVTGRVGLVVEAEATGLSPATLIGSLRGAGTVTLEGAQISGLDPNSFGAAIRAVDRGMTIDAAKISDIMEAGLQAGHLTVPRIDGAFSLNAGQARWGNVVAHGDGADLTMSGIVDLSQGLLDARLTLSGPPDAATSGRPDVFIALKGPLTAPKRTVDVAAVTGWLTLRSVERQSKRLESLQSERQEATGTTPPPGAAPRPADPMGQPSPGIAPDEAPAKPTPAPSPPRRALAPAAPPAETAPALPPPIEIRPVPDGRTPTVLQRPAASGAGAAGTTPSAAAPTPTGAVPPGAARSRSNGGQKPAAEGNAVRPPAELPPAAARRSVLDQLFGPQR